MRARSHLSAIVVFALFACKAQAQTAPPDAPAAPADPAAMAPMGQTPPAPHTAGFLEGTLFTVLTPYTWRIGSTDKSITVPSGFVTDFASIPEQLQGYLRSQAQYSRAALIHDYLYWSQSCTKTQSDNLLMIAMKETGVPVTQRIPIYSGVRIGGFAAWGQNTAQRAQGWVRVVPDEYLALADTHTWAGARQILKNAKVKEDLPPISNGVCHLGDTTDVP